MGKKINSRYSPLNQFDYVNRERIVKKITLTQPTSFLLSNKSKQSEFAVHLGNEIELCTLLVLVLQKSSQVRNADSSNRIVSTGQEQKVRFSSLLYGDARRRKHRMKPLLQ